MNRLSLLFLFLLLASPSPAQTPASTNTGRIYGSVRAGTISVAGVHITAIHAGSNKKFFAISDGSGAYSLVVTDLGHYYIHADSPAFTSTIRELTLTESNREHRLDFALDKVSANQAAQSTGSNTLSSLWPPLILPPVTPNTISLQPATTYFGGSSGAQIPSFTGDPTYSGDMFVITGLPAIVTPYFQMADQMRQDFEDGHQLQRPSMQADGGGAGFSNPGIVAPESPPPGSASSSLSQFHGVIFWSGGNSVFNAEPFVLSGQPSPNPKYQSNGYGITVGGQPFIPGLTNPSSRDSILLSYAGQLSTSIVSQYGVVPTELEREGNFSQLFNQQGQLIPIYPPRSTIPYPNNTINTPLDPAALALLQYIPESNLQSTGLNYRLLTTQGTHTNSVGASYTHSFGALPNPHYTSLGQITGTPPLTQSLNINFNYGDVATDIVNIFPGLGGKQRVQGYALTAGYTATKGQWITNVNVSESRNNSQVRNDFTDKQDIASQLGIFAKSDVNGNGVPINANPLNFGLPNLIFNNFTGMSETQPNFQLTQIFGLSGSSSWTHASHILRFGGDFRRVEFNLFGGTPDATGTYIFTGAYTETAGVSSSNPLSSSGSSFADFLLGLPQETKIESADQTAYTRESNWDLFLRDDWRILPRFTLCLGLRYDYFSPFVEKYDRLSTLDYNSGFTDIAPVQPNQIGPVSGKKYPRSLINPDRTNFSPHAGLAWDASKKTVVRAGYTVNYGVIQYGSFIQNLAYQPPFADVQANGNVPHDLTFFTLQYGFGNTADFGNYAINQNYRVPYVQSWYLDVQRALPFDLVLDLAYTGSKGARLDVVSAPGFINTLPFPSAFFDFEDSTAFSKYNALVVRLLRRFRSGLSLQASYIYSHSIDDASSTNAGNIVVAQNWQDILAEESNSSFDIRHQATGSFLYQLPFGVNKAYLSRGNWASHVFGDWTLSGFFLFATGFPLTPYVSASPAEVARGTHGSVRPNRVPGTSITAGGGQLQHWFNTNAFTLEFAPGQMFGDASRYSIPGPGTDSVNLSLSKVVPLYESKSLELRASASNAFNIVQYSGVNTQIGSSTFGFVNAVQPMRKLTFLARLRF
jgi:trimeric autotransporter adhesin